MALTLAQIKATALGTSPWKDVIDALIGFVEKNNADIAALSGGGTPGWEAAIDERWNVSVTGGTANAIQATMTDASGEDLYDGLLIRLVGISTTNTGATTLDVGTNQGAVTIKTMTDSTALADVQAGDMQNPSLLMYYNGYWLHLNPRSMYARHFVSATAPTSGDGADGDFWFVTE